MNPISIVLSLFAAGCSPPSIDNARMPLTATSAAWPARVVPADGIVNALACIRETGVLKDVIFGVGPWVDSTGKYNSVATGATGAFLPQAGTATFVTDTIKQAGGRVLVQYFGPAEVRVAANYSINGIFNSLDFGSHLSGDVRVAGIGPTLQTGWAQLTMTVQMDEAKTRLNRQTTVLTRAVRYTQVGVSSGRLWGDTLVTGGVQVHDQQRLQFEAVNGPIAVGIIDVIAKEFPAVSHCWDALSAAQGRCNLTSGNCS